jgi:hypothetical protein
MSDANLTDFVGLWNSDGTVFDLRVVAITSAGLELNLYAETPEGSSTTRVRTQLNDWSNNADRPRLPANTALSVADVLSSLDSVTVHGLASAASVTVADGESFTLWRERSWSSEQNATPDDEYDLTIGDAIPMGPGEIAQRYYIIHEGPSLRYRATPYCPPSFLQRRSCLQSQAGVGMDSYGE